MVGMKVSMKLNSFSMFVHCKQCAVKAHLPNGRYVIEVTIPARKKKAIKEYIDGPILGWITVDEPERKKSRLLVLGIFTLEDFTL